MDPKTSYWHLYPLLLGDRLRVRGARVLGPAGHRNFYSWCIRPSTAGKGGTFDAQNLDQQAELLELSWNSLYIMYGPVYPVAVASRGPFGSNISAASFGLNPKLHQGMVGLSSSKPAPSGLIRKVFFFNMVPSRQHMSKTSRTQAPDPSPTTSPKPQPQNPTPKTLNPKP